MIKLFRNIRQKLLIEGKTSKYLKYAIGEIALVVVGILIALQVNNWNEERKLKKEKDVLISNLKNEMQTTVARMSRSIIGIKERIDSGKKFIKYAPSGLPDAPTDSLRKWAELANGNWDVEPQLTAYNEAIASGKIDLIDNKSVLNSYAILLQHYEKFKRHQNSGVEIYYMGAGWELRKKKGSLNFLSQYPPDENNKLSDTTLLRMYDDPMVFAYFENIGVLQNNMLDAVKGMKEEANSIQDNL